MLCVSNVKKQPSSCDLPEAQQSATERGRSSGCGGMQRGAFFCRLADARLNGEQRRKNFLHGLPGVRRGEKCHYMCIIDAQDMRRCFCAARIVSKTRWVSAMHSAQGIDYLHIELRASRHFARRGFQYSSI